MKTTTEQIIAEAQAYYGLGENKDYEEGFIDGAYFIRRKSFNK